MENPFELIINELNDLKIELSKISEKINDIPIRKYSPKDIADNTPLSEQTVRAMIHDGRIKAEYLGSKYLITAEEFNKACKQVKSLKYKRG